MTQQTSLLPEQPRPTYAVLQSWYGWPMVVYESKSLAKVKAEEKCRRSLGYPVIDIACFTPPR